MGSANRGAYTEAHEQFANASRMIAAMPQGESHDRSELDLVLCSIMTTSFRRGAACSEIAEAHYRAMELWERLGQPVDLLTVAVGRYLFHHFRGEMRLAQELASSLLHTSQKQADPRYRLTGHLLVGYTMVTQGEFLDAEAHLEDAFVLIQSCSADIDDPWQSLPDREALTSWTLWAMAHMGLGAAKSLLGHLDQAETHLSAVVERAAPLGYATAQAEVSIAQSMIRSHYTDVAELAPSIVRWSRLTRELGLVLYSAVATIQRGYVISCRGAPEQGIGLIKEGMEAYAATDAVIWSGYHHALLAEAYQQVGRLNEARQLLVDAQDWAERSGERWYDAELARRLGEVERQQGNVKAAEKQFNQALAIARRQHAKLWELHAATSLARLRHEQRRSAEAHAVLAPVYGWFKEGLQTGSLRRAKALLDELDPRPERA